ncbi:Protein kinase domain-containing protein [Aphelenchoides fujianensis]|nr:Protein kinase domain-containing protein [Aphelenchoides fujianensis]KAI6219492.1 Protein kinase domain-containing protein [Aphelenchoides fujianensis]
MFRESAFAFEQPPSALECGQDADESPPDEEHARAAAIERRVGGRLAEARRVAKSGAASVFRVWSGRFGAEVAVKVVDTRALSPKYAAKFLRRELEIWPLMRHAFVCRSLDVFWADATTAVFLSEPYTSPEIAWQREYDPFSNDWYSAGVVLYTLLSGKWPFVSRPPLRSLPPTRPLQHADLVPAQPPWPRVAFPPAVFSRAAVELLRRLLQENAYLRADYELVLHSAFLRRHGQGAGSPPLVRGPHNSLFKLRPSC